MVALRFRFPGGRYHATPWGHHVNEGLVEWPPSPWRLARALFAVGFARHGWSEGALPAEARELAVAFAGTLPSYALPAVSTAHTRHYMPVGAKTTKVFDTFAYVGRGELWVQWYVDLSRQAHALLRALAAGLPYLGRAESWVECEMVDALPPGVTINAFPIEPSEDSQGAVLVLAPVSALIYDAWRRKAVELATTGLSQTKSKKVEATFPPDLLAALLTRTGELQSSGWTRPPGSRDVLYRIPDRALQAPPNVRAANTQIDQPVEFALYSVTGNSERGTLRPRIEQTLTVAETLHFALAKRLDGVACPEIIGRDAGGKPLVGHRHAHVLPLDTDGDRRLDHILVWAPMGMGLDAREALHAVRNVWDRDHDAAAFVQLAGTGGRHEIVAALRGLKSNACEASKTWTSCTPFVAPRYVKSRGANTLEGQVVAELLSRGLPAPRQIHVGDREAVADASFHGFVRARMAKKRAPPSTRPVFLCLEFDQAVSGPLALGYGAHFGLGQLQPN